MSDDLKHLSILKQDERKIFDTENYPLRTQTLLLESLCGNIIRIYLFPVTSLQSQWLLSSFMPQQQPHVLHSVAEKRP